MARVYPLPPPNPPPLRIFAWVAFLTTKRRWRLADRRRDGRHLSVHGGPQLFGGVPTVAAVGVKRVFLQHGFLETLEHFRRESITFFLFLADGRPAKNFREAVAHRVKLGHKPW